MRKREIMQAAENRLAYEEGYQAGVNSMFEHWCNLRSQNAQYKAEIQKGYPEYFQLIQPKSPTTSEIAKQLQLSPRAPTVKQGALYPVLRTLSAQGLLDSRVVPSISGPPRRYYRITAAGRDTLAKWVGIWRDTRDFVDNFTESQGVMS